MFGGIRRQAGFLLVLVLLAFHLSNQLVDFLLEFFGPGNINYKL